MRSNQSIPELTRTCNGLGATNVAPSDSISHPSRTSVEISRGSVCGCTTSDIRLSAYEYISCAPSARKRVIALRSAAARRRYSVRVFLSKQVDAVEAASTNSAPYRKRSVSHDGEVRQDPAPLDTRTIGTGAASLSMCISPAGNDKRGIFGSAWYSARNVDGSSPNSNSPAVHSFCTSGHT